MYSSMTDSKEQELKALIPILRSLVTARKQPCLLRTILFDYKEVEDRSLPFRYFNFNEAVDLFYYTGEFIISKNSGQIYISTKVNAKSQHIVDLVRDQKIDIKKRGRTSEPIFRQNKSHSYHQTYRNNSYPNHLYSNNSYQNGNYQNYLYHNSLYSNNNSYLTTSINKTLVDQKQRMENSEQNKNENKFELTLQQELKKQEERLLKKFEAEQIEIKKQFLNEFEALKTIPVALKKQNETLKAELKEVKGRLYQIEVNLSTNEETDNQRSHIAPPSGTKSNLINSSLKINNNSINNKSQHILNNSRKNARGSTNYYHLNLKENKGGVYTTEVDLLTNDQIESHRKDIKEGSLNMPLNAINKSNSCENESTLNANNKTFRSNVDNPNTSKELNQISLMKSKQDFQKACEKDKPISNNETDLRNYLNSVYLKKRKQETKESSPSHQTIKDNYCFNPNKNPCSSIAEYSSIHNLGEPKYLVTRLKYDGFFNCKLNLGSDMKFSTYPDTYSTEELARKRCAIKAIEHIQQQQKQNSLPAYSKDKKFLNMLYHELMELPHGMISHNMLPFWFLNKFGYKIPDSWFEMVNSSELFNVETSINKNTFIISTKSENYTSLNTVEHLKLPWSKKNWRINITGCVSTIEIYASLIENRVSLDKLLEIIKYYMNLKKVKPTKIATSYFYIVQNDDDDGWRRVQVESLDTDDDIAHCFFIDYGYKKYLSTTKLYFCDSKFLQLAPQAIKFSLFGLEDFSGNPYALKILKEHLLDRPLLVNIVTEEQDFKDNIAIQVLLSDNSKATAINFNLLIRNIIINRKKTPPRY